MGAFSFVNILKKKNILLNSIIFQTLEEINKVLKIKKKFKESWLLFF
jgi:hypothetical protein